LETKGEQSLSRKKHCAEAAKESKDRPAGLKQQTSKEKRFAVFAGRTILLSFFTKACYNKISL
jgi:hypothetical protein